MRYLFVLFTLLSCVHVRAQGVKISNTPGNPHPSALLHVDGANKGVLLPSIALTSLTDAVTIPAPANSLLIYNNGSGGVTPEGFYFNAGTSSAPNWKILTLPQQVQENSFTYANATLTGNTYSVTLQPAPSALVPGLMVHFKANQANAGACNLQVNGLAATPLKVDVTNDPAAGIIAANEIITAVYDGTQFQILGGASSGSTGGVGSSTNMVFTVTNSVNSVTTAPSLNTNFAPIDFLIRWVSGNRGFVSINVTGLPTGVTYSLSPGGGFPDFDVRLIFFANASTQPGTYSVQVNFAGGVTNITRNITLQINTLPGKIAFVTSTVHDGNLGGLAGADNICNQLSTVAGLPGTYVAWLSTTTVNAVTRIPNTAYYRTDLALIASGTSQLTGSTLTNPINFTEKGQLVFSQVNEINVWTNTGSNGQIYSTPNTCNNMTSNSTSVNGGITGSSANVDGGWTSCNCAPSCDRKYRLYCFQQ